MEEYRRYGYKSRLTFSYHREEMSSPPPRSIKYISLFEREGSLLGHFSSAVANRLDVLLNGLAPNNARRLRWGPGINVRILLGHN